MKRGTAAARRVVLRRLLAEREIAGQQELVRLLGRRGYRVTQTTVSRDLAALGAVKVPGPGSSVRYTLPRGTAGGERDLARILEEFVLTIEHSRNLVVLKTSPGAAGPVAAAVDRATPPGVLGTVAGDDTVLVITRSDNGGADVAVTLHRTMEAGK